MNQCTCNELEGCKTCGHKTVIHPTLKVCLECFKKGTKKHARVKEQN